MFARINPCGVVSLHIGLAGPASLSLAMPELDSSRVPASYESAAVGYLAWELARRGHEVSIFTTSTSVRETSVAESGNVRAVIVPRRSRGVVRDFYAAERSLLTAEMRHSALDVIEAQWTYEFAWAAIASGVPTAVMVRDNATRVFRLEPDLFRGVRLLMDRITRLRSASLVANSEYTLSGLSRSSRAHAPVIENFVGHDVQVIAAERPERPDRPYIVTVINGFSPLKNIETALAAFALLDRQRDGIPYYLVGRDSEPGGVVERYARARGLEEGLVFLGPRSHSDTMRLIRDAELLVHPSREESFGNTILEAMTLGTAVVGGHSSGNVPYLLGHGDFGLLADVMDPSALAGAMESILVDEDLRIRIATLARHEAESRYASERCVMLHEDLLSTVAKDG